MSDGRPIHDITTLFDSERGYMGHIEKCYLNNISYSCIAQTGTNQRCHVGFLVPIIGLLRAFLHMGIADFTAEKVHFTRPRLVAPSASDPTTSRTEGSTL